MMATILVLDDVPDYCDELASALSRDGNILRTATGVRDAIDLGVLIEPDVLITDWMLTNHVNGLDVAEVLKQVYPSMQTILMTGFASKDLIEDAKQFGVVEFLEKPFPMESVRKALVRSQVTNRARIPPAPIGIIETFSDGTIGHSNVVAEEMMAETEAGAFAVKLSEYFEPKEWENLKRQSLNGWVAIKPIGEKSGKWHLRSKEVRSSGVHVWALLNSKNIHLKNSAINLRLLGFAETAPEGLEKCGNVLVIEEESSVRKIANEMVRALKLFCHTAEDLEAATRLATHDPELTHVIVSETLDDEKLLELVQLTKAIKPEICFIGVSQNLGQNKKEAAVRERFNKLGIQYVMPKPWDFDRLLEAFRQSVRVIQ